MLREEQITLIQMGLEFLTKERGQKKLLPDSTIGSFLIKGKYCLYWGPKRSTKGKHSGKKPEG